LPPLRHHRPSRQHPPFTNFAPWPASASPVFPVTGAPPGTRWPPDTSHVTLHATAEPSVTVPTPKRLAPSAC